MWPTLVKLVSWFASLFAPFKKRVSRLEKERLSESKATGQLPSQIALESCFVLRVSAMSDSLTSAVYIIPYESKLPPTTVDFLTHYGINYMVLKPHVATFDVAHRFRPAVLPDSLGASQSMYYFSPQLVNFN